MYNYDIEIQKAELFQDKTA